MFFIAGIGMTLPIAVIGLALTSGYYVWLMLTGFHIGWGIAGVIFCLWYMGGAYKMMTFLNGEGGVRTNAAAAGCLPFTFQLLLALYFVASDLPAQMSAWWALLMPVTFILQLLLQAGLEFIFDAVNPSGRRK